MQRTIRIFWWYFKCLSLSGALTSKMIHVKRRITKAKNSSYYIVLLTANLILISLRFFNENIAKSKIIAAKLGGYERQKSKMYSWTQKKQHKKPIKLPLYFLAYYVCRCDPILLHLQTYLKIFTNGITILITLTCIEILNLEVVCSLLMILSSSRYSEVCINIEYSNFWAVASSNE